MGVTNTNELKNLQDLFAKNDIINSEIVLNVNQVLIIRTALMLYERYEKAFIGAVASLLTSAKCEKTLKANFQYHDNDPIK